MGKEGTYLEMAIFIRKMTFVPRSFVTPWHCFRDPKAARTYKAARDLRCTEGKVPLQTTQSNFHRAIQGGSRLAQGSSGQLKTTSLKGVQL